MVYEYRVGSCFRKALSDFALVGALTFRPNGLQVDLPYTLLQDCRRRRWFLH